MEKESCYCQPWSMPRIDESVKTAMDAVYPRRCPLCWGVAARGLCRRCLDRVPRPQWPCPRCGAASSGPVPCGGCQRRAPAFAATFAPFRYGPPLTGLILQLKYRRRIGLAAPLARALASEIENNLVLEPELLIPVPLHWRRLLKRGFNQSCEIARHLSSELRIPLARRVAVRTRHTPSQAGLDLRARRTNVRGCFALRQPLRSGAVALVDDVMTSGETVNALAKLLLAAGVEHVQVWVLARA